MTHVTVKEAAKMMNVSVRSVERAGFVMSRGIPEIAEQIHAGNLKLLPAERIARLPRDRQLAELEFVLSGGRKTKVERTIKADLNRLEIAINSMAKRWSDDDRQIACRTLHEFARQLAGLHSEESA